MLRELAVQNLALIEDVRVELQSGFCAWTGETGAGKTLLLHALGLLLGERGSTESIRSGAAELRITGRFETQRPELRTALEQVLGFSLEDDQLVLARRLTSGGRSYAYANEQPVAVTTLRQLGNLLVDVHGQRESLSLLQPSYQLQLLDDFGGLHGQRENYLHAAELVRQLRQRLAALTAAQQQRQRELALLAFEREELDAAALLPGEATRLSQERERLVHAQSLQAFAASGSAQLHDADGSVVEVLGKLLKEAQGWLALDPGLADVARSLGGMIAEVRDLADLFRLLAERCQADPERRDQVEDRLQLMRRLETKYRRSTDELIAYHATLAEKAQQLQQQETDHAAVAQELATAFAQLRQAGTELSRQRQRVAQRLAAETQKHLNDLGMTEARLEAQLESLLLGDDPLTAEVPADGLERLELLLAANRGEPGRPLRKVASGGELSRAMLALKTVLAEHDRVATLVFDEIDANVGGRLGDVLGRKLGMLGRSHQVICVTHLPQVACYAPHQWTIRKSRRGNRTATSIELLDESTRLEELASMLRGEARGETTRKEAAAMLSAAKKRWG